MDCAIKGYTGSVDYMKSLQKINKYLKIMCNKEYSEQNV